MSGNPAPRRPEIIGHLGRHAVTDLRVGRPLACGPGGCPSVTARNSGPVEPDFADTAERVIPHNR